jgi:hypothetical protein
MPFTRIVYTRQVNDAQPVKLNFQGVRRAVLVAFTPGAVGTASFFVRALYGGDFNPPAPLNAEEPLGAIGPLAASSGGHFEIPFIPNVVQVIATVAGGAAYPVYWSWLLDY